MTGRRHGRLVREWDNELGDRLGKRRRKPRHAFLRISLCIYIYTLFFCLACGSLAARDAATTPTQVVHFRSLGNIQMDIWANQERLGVTPFVAEIPIGDFYLTAVAEGLEPIMENYTVGEQEGQVALLPAIPITVESYPLVIREVTYSLSQHLDNPHLIMIGLMFSDSLVDKKILLTELDKMIDEDPLGLALKARYYLDAQDLDRAREAAARAVELWPDVAFAWRTLATVLIQEGSLQAALDAANQAVLIEPNAWRNLRVRAVVYSKMGKDRPAINDKERADELFLQFQEKAAELKR